MNEDVGSIETNTSNRNMNTLTKNWIFFVAGTLKSTQGDAHCKNGTTETKIYTG